MSQSKQQNDIITFFKDSIRWLKVSARAEIAPLLKLEVNMLITNKSLNRTLEVSLFVCEICFAFYYILSMRWSMLKWLRGRGGIYVKNTHPSNDIIFTTN